MQLHVTTRARTGGCDIGQWSQRTISTCDSAVPSHAQLAAAHVTGKESAKRSIIIGGVSFVVSSILYICSQ